MEIPSGIEMAMRGQLATTVRLLSATWVMIREVSITTECSPTTSRLDVKCVRTTELLVRSSESLLQAQR
ncbi:hypothetical protein J6590_021110 [Homalodisca vitripennis]|nr:hypothetical protein J6590_021110 [Homalodisca vitripennis]